MILTPHALLGAAVANLVPNEPVLGFALAFFSHYVLDMIPHKDYDINSFMDKKTSTMVSIFKSSAAAIKLLFIILEAIGALILCFLIFVKDEKSAVITLLGIIGAWLPDFFQLLYYKFKKQPFIFFQRLHDKMGRDIENKKYIWFGISIQIFVSIIVLVIYFIIKK